MGVIGCIQFDEKCNEGDEWTIMGSGERRTRQYGVVCANRTSDETLVSGDNPMNGNQSGHQIVGRPSNAVSVDE